MRIATCIEHSDVSAMCKLCRDKDIAIVNGKEYSNDLLEYSESRGNPHLTVISEYGLYRIFAKCNLPKCEPISNPLIPVFSSGITCESRPSGSHFFISEKVAFLVRKYLSR